MLTCENSDLWARLEAFRVDDDSASLSSSPELHRTSVVRSFTDGVIVEYRRFVFLAMTVEHQVTPSEQVDQVWHLHRKHTVVIGVAYWNDRCVARCLDETVASKKVTTVGGAAQRMHWNDTYSQTLASYRRVFGSEPPSDIWPAPVERFAAVPRCLHAVG